MHRWASSSRRYTGTITGRRGGTGQTTQGAPTRSRFCRNRGWGDRAIEYLWGGPKLNWFQSPPGIPLTQDFGTWVRDTSIDWGGYLTPDNPNDGTEMFIAAPLGPRWSCWHLDMCIGRGPDFGLMKFQVATAPFFRRCEGIIPTGFGGGTANERYDIAAPDSLGDFDMDWRDLTWQVNAYNATEVFNDYRAEVGSTVRITGQHGRMLSDVDTGLCQPLTGHSFDSGDGLMYYFRLYIDGKDASSSGFNFRIQAVRLSRALENDGTLI